MAMNITLATLVSRIRKRGEIRSNRVADTVLHDWINSAIAELYRLIADINPDFYVTSQAVTVVSGTAQYALAPTFWIGYGCDVLDDSSHYTNLRPFRWADRNKHPEADTAKTHCRYRFIGGNLELRPTPAWAGTVRVWYVPAPPVLTTTTPGTTDVWDSIAGFDEFVILSCLVKHATVEDEDVSGIAAQLQSARRDIISQVTVRDKAEPPRTRDVYGERAARSWPTWDNP